MPLTSLNGAQQCWWEHASAFCVPCIVSHWVSALSGPSEDGRVPSAGLERVCAGCTLSEAGMSCSISTPCLLGGNNSVAPTALLLRPVQPAWVQPCGMQELYIHISPHECRAWPETQRWVDQLAQLHGPFAGQSECETNGCMCAEAVQQLIDASSPSPPTILRPINPKIAPV